jgi:hypothetical protein
MLEGLEDFKEDFESELLVEAGKGFAHKHVDNIDF